MNKTLLTTCYLLLTIISSFAQNNVGFENGDFTGWEGYTGCNPTAINYTIYPGNCTESDSCCPNIGFVTSGLINPPLNTNNVRHAIMSDSGGVDPCGSFPVIAPYLNQEFNSRYSMRLGNNVPQGRAERIQKNFTVTPDQTKLLIQYALVLNDPSGHGFDEMPAFEMIAFDQNGDTIPCGYYFRISSDSDFTASAICNNIKILNWTGTVLELNNHVGTDLSIRFSTRDCGQGGHYGYGYIDGAFLPDRFKDTICTNETVKLKTPPGGYTSFLWNTGDTTEEITVSKAGSYSVTASNQNNCASAFDFDVVKIEVNSISWSTNELNQPINFNSNTPYSNDSSISYYWDFGDGTFSVDKNPQHTYTDSGTYKVCLTISNINCADSVCKMIDIISVGLNENNLEEQCCVIENSGDGNFQISNFQFRISNFQLIDLQGKEIFTGEIQGNEINIQLTNYPKAIYLLKLQTEQGIKTIKLIR